ncbi:MAG: hypothetical protein WDZ40_00840 [Candidatus Spechtbacterales bacterium]
MLDISKLSKEDLRLLREACRAMAWTRWGAKMKRHPQNKRYEELMCLIDKELGGDVEYRDMIEETNK